MALYYENGAFGGGSIKLTDLTASTPAFFGSEIVDEWVTDATTRKDYLVPKAKKSASATKGIDIGKNTGNYKDQYTVRLRVIGLMGLADTATVTFEIAGSADDVTYTDAVSSVTVTGKTLKEACNTPIEMSIPSFKAYQYFCLGVTASAVPEAGELVASIEPTAW